MTRLDGAKRINLGGSRGRDFLFEFTVPGDATGVAFAGELRAYPDAPGEPLASFEFFEGNYDSDADVTTLTAEIGRDVMVLPDALPIQLGGDVELSYDVTQTKDGFLQTLYYGAFKVFGAVTRASGGVMLPRNNSEFNLSQLVSQSEFVSFKALTATKVDLSSLADRVTQTETEVQYERTARSYGVVTAADETALDLLTGPPQGSVAWVRGGMSGQYEKTAAAGTAGWTRTGDLPEIALGAIRAETEAARDTALASAAAFRLDNSGIDLFSTEPIILTRPNGSSIPTIDGRTVTIQDGNGESFISVDVDLSVGDVFLLVATWDGNGSNLRINLADAAGVEVAQDITADEVRGSDYYFRVTSGVAARQIKLSVDTRFDGNDPSVSVVELLGLYLDRTELPAIDKVPGVVQIELDRLGAAGASTTQNLSQIDTFVQKHRARIAEHEARFGSHFGLAQAQARAFSAQSVIWVDQGGDDAAAGTDVAPVQSYAQALSDMVTAGGGTAVLRAGQSFFADRAGAALQSGAHYTSAPAGSVNAQLEHRTSLEGQTWTNESGAIWSTVFTMSDIPADNTLKGVAPDSFHFAVWDDADRQLEWKVGEADIAANRAAMTAGTMVAHFDGSTAQDLRGDLANKSADVKLFVWLFDGADPNGRAVKATDYHLPSGNGSVIGGTFTGIDTGFNYDKDNMGVAADALGRIPVIGNLTARQAPMHGFVGPCHIVGQYAFIGRGVEGLSGYRSANGDLMRRGSGGLNCFTSTFYPDLDLYWSSIRVKNAAIGGYGHGSGNQGYRSITIGYADMENGTNAFRFDLPSSGPFLIDGLTVQWVDIREHDNGFSNTGDLYVGGGSLETSTELFVQDTQFNLVENNIASNAFTWVFENFTLKNERTYVGFASDIALILLTQTPANNALHTLVLDNVTDLSDPDKAFHFSRQLSDGFPVHVIIKGGSVLGDLFPRTTTKWPAQLTLEAGVTLGFGGRDFATLVTDLDAAGVVHNLNTLAADDITLVPARTV